MVCPCTHGQLGRRVAFFFVGTLIVILLSAMERYNGSLFLLVQGEVTAHPLTLVCVNIWKPGSA